MATAAKTARAVEVPGEPTQPIAEPVVAEQAQQPAGSTEQAAEPSAEVSGELAALRAQLAEEQAARRAAEARAVSASTGPKVAAVSTKGSAVLTEKGWAVPASYGAPAVKA